MTLTPDDLAAMGERHVKSAYLNAKRHEQCRDDREPWPCDSRRLLDEVEALRFALEEIAEYQDLPEFAVAAMADIARKALEEVRSPEVTEPST